MLREETIEYFEFHRKIFCEDHLKICPEGSIAYQATLKEKEFYDLAIKALKREPCEDVISREELKKWLDMNFSFGGASRKIELFDRLDKELPPVTPKQEPVLDKIRAEIVDLGQRTMNDNRASGIWACRDIIDKYKAESNG